MLKKEFDFILQDELIYAHGGNAKNIAKRLLLRAPTTKLLPIAGKLNSIITGAFVKAHEKYKDNKSKSTEVSDGKIDGAIIYMMVSGSIEQKQMDELINSFTDLILSDGICLIDGKEPITQDLFNSLDTRETIRLMGDYMGNFLLPSVMQNSK